jgi:hypothetical protein
MSSHTRASGGPDSDGTGADTNNDPDTTDGGDSDTDDPARFLADAHADHEYTAASAFVDLLQRDRSVCNNCFRRQYDVAVTERLTREHGWVTAQFWTPRPAQTQPAHADRQTRGLTSACDCGVIGHAKRRPLPTPLAVEFAEHIADTLADKRVPHDRETLLAEVRERKADPAVQGREDTDVFAPAVRAAIRAAPANSDTDTDAESPDRSRPIT